jgi:hypothetical protein
MYVDDNHGGQRCIYKDFTASPEEGLMEDFTIVTQENSGQFSQVTQENSGRFSQATQENSGRFTKATQLNRGQFSRVPGGRHVM